MNKIRSIIATAIIASCVIACQSPKATDETSAQDTVKPGQKVPLTLNLKWETDPTLTTCESVLYDQERDVLYVSNINGQPDGKDGNGFISKLNLDGKVTELEWVKGLNAPKGLGHVVL